MDPFTTFEHQQLLLNQVQQQQQLHLQHQHQQQQQLLHQQHQFQPHFYQQQHLQQPPQPQQQQPPQYYQQHLQQHFHQQRAIFNQGILPGPSYPQAQHQDQVRMPAAAAGLLQIPNAPRMTVPASLPAYPQNGMPRNGVVGSAASASASGGLPIPPNCAPAMPNSVGSAQPVMAARNNAADLQANQQQLMLYNSGQNGNLLANQPIEQRPAGNPNQVKPEPESEPEPLSASQRLFASWSLNVEMPQPKLAMPASEKTPQMGDQMQGGSSGQDAVFSDNKSDVQTKLTCEGPMASNSSADFARNVNRNQNQLAPDQSDMRKDQRQMMMPNYRMVAPHLNQMPPNNSQAPNNQVPMMQQNPRFRMNNPVAPHSNQIQMPPNNFNTQSNQLQVMHQNPQNQNQMLPNNFVNTQNNHLPMMQQNPLAPHANQNHFQMTPNNFHTHNNQQQMMPPTPHLRMDPVAPHLAAAAGKNNVNQNQNMLHTASCSNTMPRPNRRTDNNRANVIDTTQHIWKLLQGCTPKRPLANGAPAPPALPPASANRGSSSSNNNCKSTPTNTGFTPAQLRQRQLISSNRQQRISLERRRDSLALRYDSPEWIEAANAQICVRLPSEEPVKMRGLCRVCGNAGGHPLDQPIPFYVHERPSEAGEWPQTIGEMLADLCGTEYASLISNADDSHMPQTCCTCCISSLKHAIEFRRRTMHTVQRVSDAIRSNKDTTKTDDEPLPLPKTTTKEMPNENPKTIVNGTAATKKNKKSLNVDVMRSSLAQFFAEDLNTKNDRSAALRSTLHSFFNYAEAPFDGFVETAQIFGQLPPRRADVIDDLLYERKCFSCDERFMLHASYAEHIGQCTLRQLHRFTDHCVRLTRLLWQMLLPEHEFIRRMVFAVRRLAGTLALCQRVGGWVEELPPSEAEAVRQKVVPKSTRGTMTVEHEQLNVQDEAKAKGQKEPINEPLTHNGTGACASPSSGGCRLA